MTEYGSDCTLLVEGDEWAVGVVSLGKKQQRQDVGNDV